MLTGDTGRDWYLRDTSSDFVVEYVSDGDGDGYVSYRKREQRVSCSKLTTGDEEETKYMVEVEVEPRLTRPANLNF